MATLLDAHVTQTVTVAILVAVRVLVLKVEIALTTTNAAHASDAETVLVVELMRLNIPAAQIDHSGGGLLWTKHLIARRRCHLILLLGLMVVVVVLKSSRVDLDRSIKRRCRRWRER